jgi:hypothetical protein
LVTWLKSFQLSGLNEFNCSRAFNENIIKMTFRSYEVKNERYAPEAVKFFTSFGARSDIVFSIKSR